MKKHKNRHGGPASESRSGGRQSGSPGKSPGKPQGKPQGKSPDRSSAKKPESASAGKAAPRPDRSPPAREFSRESRLERPGLYGVHAVSAAWLNEDRKIQALYVCDQALDSLKPAMEEARRKGIARPDATLVDRKKLEFLLPAGAVHQGLAIVSAPLPETGLRDLLIQGEEREKSLILILDQITDPHNVGAILRSACAFGATGVIMQRRHAPELTGALAKAACGALEHVPVAFETNISRSIEELQEAGYHVYGLDERGEKSIGDVKFSGRVALVLGAEGPGLRHLVKERCDMLVRLPMEGPMPSVNVSNAAAIALYVMAEK